MNQKIRTAIEDLSDLLETEYGKLEGFEVSITHNINEGGIEEFPTITGLVLVRLTKTIIEI